MANDLTPPSDARDSDAALLDLLRVEGPCGIGTMAGAMGVTATAVRQRLERLMRSGHVARETRIPAGGTAGRGRPAHAYSLTDKGRRTGGDNFQDLSLVLWQEIRQIKDPSVRRGLFSRVGAALADVYRGRLTGESPAEKLESVAGMFRERRLSCSVKAIPGSGHLPVLTTYSCPYPELAEQDRGICATEREMLQQLVGSTVQLTECRLDGATCCQFTVVGGCDPRPDLPASAPPQSAPPQSQAP